jgi:hypothetical protein
VPLPVPIEEVRVDAPAGGSPLTSNGKWTRRDVARLGAPHDARALAVGTMDAEMFPTEVRGTSNALLLVAYVLGSVVGLVLAGQLSDSIGGLGNAIALCGIAPIIAAVFLLPRLPESSGHELDDVSPSEV